MCYLSLSSREEENTPYFLTIASTPGSISTSVVFLLLLEFPQKLQKLSIPISIRFPITRAKHTRQKSVLAANRRGLGFGNDNFQNSYVSWFCVCVVWRTHTTHPHPPHRNYSEYHQPNASSDDAFFHFHKASTFS